MFLPCLFLLEFLLFFFIFGRTNGLWNFPGQELSRSCSKARSLTHVPQQELLDFF